MSFTFLGLHNQKKTDLTSADVRTLLSGGIMANGLYTGDWIEPRPSDSE